MTNRSPVRAVQNSQPKVVFLAGATRPHQKIAELGLAASNSVMIMASKVHDALQAIAKNSSVSVLAISAESLNGDTPRLLNAVDKTRTSGRRIDVVVGCDFESAITKLTELTSYSPGRDTVFVTPSAFHSAIRAVLAGVALPLAVSTTPRTPRAVQPSELASTLGSALMKLRWQFADISKQLEELTASTTAEQDLQPQPSRSPSLTLQRQLELLQFIKELDRVRSQSAAVPMDAQPAWNILAELYKCSLLGTKIAFKSVCLASQVPITTAFRKLDELVTAGLVMRSTDSADRRRINAVLTAGGVQLVFRVLQAYEEAFRQFQALP